MSEIQIEETETEAELEVKEEARTVYADKLDLDVATICNRIQQGELILQPEFQREYVWDDTKASRFIESILMQIPTPVIYLAEDEEGKQLTIDGHQRLSRPIRLERTRQEDARPRTRSKIFCLLPYAVLSI